MRLGLRYASVWKASGVKSEKTYKPKSRGVSGTYWSRHTVQALCFLCYRITGHFPTS